MSVYVVGREKVREYAHAIGETSPLCHDVEAARAAGFADVVAPPMFACVYSWPALAPVVLDPEVGVDFSRLVHGGQRAPARQRGRQMSTGEAGGPRHQNFHGSATGKDADTAPEPGDKRA